MNYTLEANMPVAVFDSGLGGLSTLIELRRLMPCEDYIYYGDFANSPYGTKSADRVRELSFDCVGYLLARRVKAIVIACNTATSAAAKQLRECYPFIPIIGAEPAIRPAVLYKAGSNILVMATDMTLKEEKFKALCAELDKMANIIKLPCPDLVEFVERGETESRELYLYLKQHIESNIKVKIDSVVLGCTHYPFVAHAISQTVGKDVPIFDGNKGIAKECRRRLAVLGLERSGGVTGTLEITGSKTDEQKLMTAKKLMENKWQTK